MQKRLIWAHLGVLDATTATETGTQKTIGLNSKQQLCTCITLIYLKYTYQKYTLGTQLFDA